MHVHKLLHIAGQLIRLVKQPVSKLHILQVGTDELLKVRKNSSNPLLHFIQLSKMLCRQHHEVLSMQLVPDCCLPPPQLLPLHFVHPPLFSQLLSLPTMQCF